MTIELAYIRRKRIKNTLRSRLLGRFGHQKLKKHNQASTTPELSHLQQTDWLIDWVWFYGAQAAACAICHLWPPHEWRWVKLNFSNKETSKGSSKGSSKRHIKVPARQNARKYKWRCLIAERPEFVPRVWSTCPLSESAKFAEGGAHPENDWWFYVILFLCVS